MSAASPPPDRTRISMCDLLEVRYWCKHLGVSEAALRDAVTELGSAEVCRVKAHLAGIPAIPPQTDTRAP
jgi:hypothetical protein